MKILQLTPYFAPAFCYGGPPRSILGLCKALRQIDIVTSVFTTTANGASDFNPSTTSGDCYETVPVHYFPRNFPNQYFKSKQLERALAAKIREFDLVHLHGLWNLTVRAGAHIAHKNGVPYVISPRGMLDVGSMAHKGWRKQIAFTLYERDNLQNAAFIHATSESEAEMIRSYKFKPEVFVLPNGVSMPIDADQLKGIDYRKKLKLNSSSKFIVFLGRIHPVKRLDLLAAAFDQVRASINDVHLLIAGPNENNYRQQLKPFFVKSSESVHWLGEVDQVEKWSLLSGANALVMCSDSESFSMSVAEAMAAGTPVVATHTCPWQQLETERCGFWVKQDSQSIAEALLKILNNPDEASAMGKRGATLAAKNYQWEAIAKQMVSYYQQAILK